MRVLGIDPGLAIVGYGVVNKAPDNRVTPIDYGVVNTPKELRVPERLVLIRQGLTALIEKYKPDAVAVEELFFTQNVTTGISVAQARGVILLTAQESGISLYEYTPLQIKQSLTGNGRAEKAQVQFMVRGILGLSAVPKPDDAADALAVALTHCQFNQRLAASTRI